jgi:Pathogenicity locus
MIMSHVTRHMSLASSPATRRRRPSKRTTRKATHARLATVLEAIPNVGASIARDLRSIGIKQPRDLIGRDAHSLYQALCDRTCTRQDPCVLDTFISAVRFMEGAPARPWWFYTAERKKKFPAISLGAPSHASQLAKAFGVAPAKAGRKIVTARGRK